MELQREEPLDMRSSIIKNGGDPDLIAKSLSEFIELRRWYDETSKRTMSKEEYWERELEYSKLEEFVLALTVYHNPKPNNENSRRENLQGDL